MKKPSITYIIRGAGRGGGEKKKKGIGRQHLLCQHFWGKGGKLKKGVEAFHIISSFTGGGVSFCCNTCLLSGKKEGGKKKKGGKRVQSLFLDDFNLHSLWL